MFCSTLRRRPSFSSAIPTLTSKNGLNLKENSLKTQDLTLPIPSHTTNNSRTLRVLLLSPTAVSQAALPASLSRIRHFAALDGGSDSVIIFLLALTSATAPREASTSASAPAATTTPASASAPTAHGPSPPSGLYAYTQLSVTLMADPSIPTIPILPLASLTSLDSLLKTYIKTLTGVPSSTTSAHRAGTGPAAATSGYAPAQRYSLNAALDILPWCTSGAAPLSREAVLMLTDLFRSLDELAAVAVAPPNDTRAKEMARRMAELLGDETARDVLEFWREEWIAE